MITSYSSNGTVAKKNFAKRKTSAIKESEEEYNKTKKVSKSIEK
jgi:hypothetical protein